MNGRESHSNDLREEVAEEYSFDELAKRVANGTISRFRVLKLAGATLFLGGALSALWPQEARARKRRRPEPICLGPRDTSITANRRFAQVFTAPRSGQLIWALVEVSCVPAGTDFVLEIRTVDSSGTPTATILTTEQVNDVPLTTISPPRPLDVTFDPPVDVVVGKKYALSLTDGGATGSGYCGSIRNIDPCPGQLFTDAQANGTFVAQSGEDLVYAVRIK